MAAAISNRDSEALQGILAVGVDEDTLEGQLELAAANFDETIVLKLLRGREFDPDEMNAALLAGTRAGSVRVVRELLDAGVACPFFEGGKRGVMDIAIEAGHVDLVELLLELVGSRIVDAEENTPLIAATMARHRRVIEVTIEACDVDAANVRGQTALMLACQNADLPTANALLEAGASPNLKDENDRSALAYAVRSGDPNVVRNMLGHGCDPNETAYSSNVSGPGGPVLLDAARHGYETICNLLLESGADLNGHGRNAHSPLYAAACGGHSLLVRLLLGWGADPNRTDNDGVTPLMAAAKANAVQSIRALVSAGAPIEARDRHGNTALMHADRSEAVGTLLESGASKNARNALGKTALVVAVEDTLGAPHFSFHKDGKTTTDRDTKIPAIGTLLLHGCSVDSQDDDGNTSLIIAAGGGRVDVVQTLLSNGARPDIRNRQGLTALDAATRNGHDDAVRILETTNG